MKGPVTCAAFSHDGKRIITASYGMVRIWDAAGGKLIGEPIMGHQEEGLITAALSPDGRRIVTASNEKSARIWDVFPDTQALVSAAKAAVPRCLKPERKAFLLVPEPPAWCIEMAKWPYHTPEWKQWLTDKRAGKNSPLPAN